MDTSNRGPELLLHLRVAEELIRRLLEAQAGLLYL